MPYLLTQNKEHCLYVSDEQLSDSQCFKKQCNTIIHWKDRHITPIKLFNLKDGYRWEDLKQSNALLRLHFHPDKNPDENKDEVTQAFIVLQAAFDYMCNAEQIPREHRLSEQSMHQNLFFKHYGYPQKPLPPKNILEQQYETLNDPNNRALFRTELIKLTGYELENSLNRQCLSSLNRLIESVQNILLQEIQDAYRNKFNGLLSKINTVSAKKKLDVPVAYEALLDGFTQKNSFRVDPNPNEPYFQLLFPAILNKTLKNVLKQYQYWDQELLIRTTYPDIIYLSKINIKGKENEINSAIGQAILNHKNDIISSLKQNLRDQQKRCQAEPSRLSHANLKRMSALAQHQIQKLDELIHDTHTGAHKIVHVIDSVDSLSNKIDDAIKQFKQEALNKLVYSQNKYRLFNIIQEQQPVKQEINRHPWSQYEIGAFIVTIAPREGDSFLTVFIESKSELVNSMITEMYKPYETKDPKTFVMAQKGYMLHVDKHLLEKNADLTQRIIETLFSQKEQIIAELTQSLNNSIARCISDEQRKSSTELAQLQQQGVNKLTELNKVNTPELLIKAIDETGIYSQRVSAAIHVFKELDSTAGIAP